MGEKVFPLRKSFVIFGISVKTDGTEDTEVHCMKEIEVAFGARDSVKKGSEALLQPKPVGDEEGDPFADLDFEEKDESELEIVLDDDYHVYACANKL